MFETGTTRCWRSTSTSRRSTCRRCPACVHVMRTARNVTTKTYDFKGPSPLPTGRRSLVPSQGGIKAGESKAFTIIITSSAPTGQYFGEIRLERPEPGRSTCPSPSSTSRATSRWSRTAPGVDPVARHDDVHRHGDQRDLRRHEVGVGPRCTTSCASPMRAARRGQRRHASLGRTGDVRRQAGRHAGDRPGCHAGRFPAARRVRHHTDPRW